MSCSVGTGSPLVWVTQPSWLGYRLQPFPARGSGAGHPPSCPLLLATRSFTCGLVRVGARARVPCWAQRRWGRPDPACRTAPGPGPAPGHRGARAPGPHSSSCPCSALPQLWPSQQSPGLFLRKGRGQWEGALRSPLLALAPPLPHTQWDRNKAGWEALTPRLSAHPEGGGPDAWVPLRGLGLISGKPGVLGALGLGCRSRGVFEGVRVRMGVGVELAGWTIRGSERSSCVVWSEQRTFTLPLLALL